MIHDNPFKKIIPGKQLSAGELTRAMTKTERANKIHGGEFQDDTPHGTDLSQQGSTSHRIRLSSGSGTGPFAWDEVIEDPTDPGEYLTTGLTGTTIDMPAYERTGTGGRIGDVYDAEYDPVNARLVFDATPYSPVLTARVYTTSLPASSVAGFGARDNTLTATSNGALPSQDGVSLAVGDRILYNPSSGFFQGVLTVIHLGSASTKWVIERSMDANTAAKLHPGKLVVVTEGTEYADTLWQMTANDPFTLNSTAAPFQEITHRDPVLYARLCAVNLPAYTRSTNTLTASANGVLVIDGVTPVAGERFLLNRDGAHADNGLYILTRQGVAGGGGSAWIADRTSDANTSGKWRAGKMVKVTEGTNFADTLWTLDQESITLNTTALGFSRIGSPSADVVYCRACADSTFTGYTRTGNTITGSSNGALAIDSSVNMALGEYFLLNSGTNADNGPYVVTTVGDVSNPFVAVRAPEASTSARMISGKLIKVSEGASYKDSLWQLITNGPITLNTTALRFSRMADFSRDVNSWRHVGSTPFSRTYFAGVLTNTTVGPFAPTVEILYALPLYLTPGGVIDKLRFQVVTAGEAGAKARMGIYQATSLTNLWPNNRIVDGGEIAVDSLGVKDMTVSVTLEPNILYWAVLLHNNVTIQAEFAGQEAIDFFPIWGNDDTDLAPLAGIGHYTAQSYGALPATFPAAGSHTYWDAAYAPKLGMHYSSIG